MCLRVIVLSCIVTLCVTKHCCMPPQWEGMVAMAGGAIINHKGTKSNDFMNISFDGTNQKQSIISNVTVGEHHIVKRIIKHFKPDFMNISFDGTNQKQSIISNVTVGEHHIVKRIIKHFKPDVMYTIDLMTKQCTKSEIKIPFEPACLPDSAKLGAEVVYGGGSHRIQCQTYTWKQTGPGENLDFLFAVVQEDEVCYPVAAEIVGTASDIPVVETFGFVNISNGIKDPSIFSPPSYCNQVPKTASTVTNGPSFLGLYI